MSSVQVSMPQMAVRGLSENWLFKYCGDKHWQELCRRHGVASHALQDEQGERVYSSFVAIRARYAAPLCSVGENDQIDFDIALSRFGPAVIHSMHTGSVGGKAFLSVEMITKFVARQRNHSNDLRQTSIRAKTIEPVVELDAPPALTRDFQTVRGEKAYRIAAEGDVLPVADCVGEATYTPNPFVDYNGAGLLYFASYPAISDHLERLILMQATGYGAIADRDWALLGSTLSRDIFYFGNLDLGQSIRGRLFAVERLPAGLRLAMALETADGSKRLAEIHSLKALAP